MTQSVRVHIANAFVDGDRGGNAAGIVYGGESYASVEKQAIAAAVGLSETAFISASSRADFKLEFFTPTSQVGDCGHATVAAFAHLRKRGLIAAARSSKEVLDGVREIRFDGEAIFMAQAAPQFTSLDTQATGVENSMILDSLGISTMDLAMKGRPMIVNTGENFMIVPLADARALRAIRPDLRAIAAISKTLGLVGYYLFSPETSQPGRDAGARMLAPAYGIDEESATGMAAGPLASYLYTQLGIAKDELLIEQGNYMIPASPSLLTVRLQTSGERILGLTVGGHAQEKGYVEIPLATLNQTTKRAARVALSA